MNLRQENNPDSGLEERESSLWSKALHFALRRDPNIPLLHFAFAVFALFTFFMVFYHVPWGDEAQPWLFARNLGFWGLVIEARHNGHPILWFLCLKAVQATGANYLGMMVLNWLFIMGAVWLLFYRSTLSLAARIGVAYTPACILEIAFTARDYAIAALLCFVAALLYKKVEEKPLRFSVVLALLASTNVFAFAVFIGISFQFLLEQAFTFGRSSFSLRPLYTKYFLANLILVFGALFLVLQLAPVRLPGDTVPNVASVVTIQPSRLLDPSWIILFLVPVVLVLFRKDPRYPRVFGGMPIVFVASMPALIYGCTSRHYFMLVLGVVYFCWVYLDAFIRGGAFGTRKLGAVGINVLVTFLILLACLGTRPGGLKQAYYHISDSRRAATAIIQHDLDRPDTILVTSDPFRVAPLFLFFKNIHEDYAPPEFGPSPQTFAQDAYIRFRLDLPSLLPLKPMVLDLARKNPGKTILVIAMGSNGSDDFPANDPGYQLIPIYKTPPSPRIGVNSESYQVYVLRQPTPAP